MIMMQECYEIDDDLQKQAPSRRNEIQTSVSGYDSCQDWVLESVDEKVSNIVIMRLQI